MVSLRTIKSNINRLFDSLFNNFINKLAIIRDFISEFKKIKRKLFLEHSFLSYDYFEKILPEKDLYINNFKELFYSNNPFTFAKDNERFNIIGKINNDFSEFKKKIVLQAELILKNEYLILGKKHNFINKVNWFYSFFNNYFWPFKRSDQIKWILNRKTDIDLKFSLRLNYHQDFVTLGLAFFITKDEIYSEKFYNLISDWIKKNPPNWGINWIDFLEVTHRVVNWIFALSFFKDSKYLTELHFKKIAKSLYQQIFFIKLNNNKHTYNHTIGEQFIVFLFSSIFKTIKPINKWYKKSKKILMRQIKRQIQEDGVNIEQSTHYHRMVLEIFILFIKTKYDLIPPDKINIIERMFEFLKFIIKPDTKIPLIGDSDDAHFIPLIFFNGVKNINLGLLNLGAALFNRSDFKLYCNDDIRLLVLLLMGITKYNEFEKLVFEPVKKNFKYFHKSGYLIGKSNWSNRANFLFFDMGQFGPKKSSHDHSDISNIIYSFRGKPILIDSGTYMYNISSNKRNLFRSSKAHNILSINNQNQAKISGTWSWEKIPNIHRKFVQYKNVVSAIVEHNGYKKFLVRRQIIASNNLTMLKIIETIIPLKKIEKETKISCFFHFPINIQIGVYENYVIIDSNLKLELLTNIRRFKIIKEDFPYSSYYGIKEEAQLITFNFIYNFNKKEPLKMKYIFSNLNKN